MKRHLAPGQFIAEFRGQFVLLLGDGILELLVQRAADGIVVAERFPQLRQTDDQIVVIEEFFRLVFRKQPAQFVEAQIDFVDRRFGRVPLQFGEGRRLRAMEHDKRAILLMGQDPLLVRRVAGAEVHQGERVIGVADRLVKFTQGQPADPAMIELDEFAIHFATLRVADREIVVVNRLAYQVIEIRFETKRPGAVRPVRGLQLEESHVDPHLDYGAPIVTFFHAHVDRLRVVLPLPQQAIDVVVLASGHQYFFPSFGKNLVLSHSTPTIIAKWLTFAAPQAKKSWPFHVPLDKGGWRGVGEDWGC